jgi:7,8-dihydropterin-6-yl-methyl-4-(beta-D-ribofuranosyl)aminobenzene 5'-phosphate synthase
LHAQKITAEQSIYMTLGGTHLFKASKERLKKIIAALKELGVKKIGASHCTGLSTAALLAQEFGDDFFFNNAGTCIEL